MKKLILLFLVLCSYLLNAQESIPNAGFENWNTLNYSYPLNYNINVNNEDNCIRTGIFPITKVAGYHGNYGVQLKTTAEMGLAYMLTNYNPSNNDPSTWHGGVPYSQKPTGLRGYYKYNYSSSDQGLIILAFSKNGSNIGTYYVTLSDKQTDYTLFDVNFTPALADTPDSIIIAAASSMPGSPVVGSTLVIDSISFKGVDSQPAFMNGDFEQWVDNSVDVADGWNSSNQDFQAVKKTTDAYKGQYAVELTTFMGKEDNQPQVKPAQILTGYYPDNCNDNCYPLGGDPFSNQSDTLAFYYKYVPVGTDQANVGLYFKKKDSGQDGWYAGTSLQPTSEYMFVKIPFNLSFVPDSVIIQIQSSDWNSVSSANVGSDLKIDDMCFLSQKTWGKNEIILKSDANTLGAGVGAGYPTQEMIDALNTASNIETLDFQSVDVDAAGTWTIIPPNAPEGTAVINIHPSDGENGYFKLNFVLPQNFMNVSLRGSANIDDLGRAFLNGNPITSSIGESSSINEYGNVYFQTENSAYFKEGDNEIIFSDANTGGGPSGAAFYVIINYDLASGLNNAYYNSLDIYPNPVEKGFFIKSDLSVDNVIIDDIRGSEVLRQSNINNYVDVNTLPKGIYIVRLQTKSGVYNGKLIKK